MLIDKRYQLPLSNDEPISRQEVLNHVLEKLKDGGLNGTDAEKIVYQAILETPPAIEHAKWIPVSEKLPENVHEKVWVSYYPYYDKEKYICTGVANCLVTDYGRVVWHVEGHDLYACKVLEWMPLPKSRYETAYEQQMEKEQDPSEKA